MSMRTFPCLRCELRMNCSSFHWAIAVSECCCSDRSPRRRWCCPVLVCSACWRMWCRSRHVKLVRLSLGANPADVFRLVVGRGMILALSGSVIGLICAFQPASVAQELLFKIGPNDPIGFLGAVGLLLGVALLACYVPGRRATRVALPRVRPYFLYLALFP